MSINAHFKCKPPDSQTRQEVKADEQKTNNRAGEQVCLTETCS